MKRIIAIIILIILVIFLYGHFIEVNNLKVNYYDLDGSKLPESFKELKIVHFSDILYNKNEKQLEKVVKLINEEEADIVIFSGDLLNKSVNYNENDYKVLQEQLKNVNANLYKLAIAGENDEKNINKYEELLKNADFTYLNNSNKLLFYKDTMPINIIGLTNLNNINELLITEVETNYNLVIMHKPDNFNELSNLGIDLVLSGHTLGGIINIPYYGGLIKKSSKYVNGSYENNNSTLYVSNGIGYKNYNFRLLNTPSINVYRFK